MFGLDSYSRQVLIIWTHFDLYQSLNRLPIWNSQNCIMFPLAFVAGWLQGHWWGFISRNYVVWPTFLLMNVFIALKGSHFWFLFTYVGLAFTMLLSYQRMCSDLAKKGKRVLVSLTSSLYDYGQMPKHVFFKSFDTKVVSILVYGSDIWGFKWYDILEQVQNYACICVLMWNRAMLLF